MAAGWIRIRGSLLRSPKLIAMAAYLQEQRDFREWMTPGGGGNGQLVSDEASQCVTLALLTVTWSNAREFGKPVGNDVVLEGIGLGGIDLMCGAPHFGEAMDLVGWAKDNDDNSGVILPNFMEWNSLAEKQPAKTGAERARDYRARSKNNSNENRHDNVTKNRDESNESNAREEKSREEETPLPPKGAKTQKFDPAEAEIPEQLDIAGFRDAWAEWCRYRAEKKKPLTPTSVKQQLKQLAALGHGRACELIERSITNSYTGLIFPEDKAAAQSATATAGQRERELADTRRRSEEQDRIAAQVAKERAERNGSADDTHF